MVIKNDMGKARKDKGTGKSGLMAPVGSQHWEKDVADVNLSQLKYTTNDSMDNAEHLKKSVDEQSSYARKHSMNKQYNH